MVQTFKLSLHSLNLWSLGLSGHRTGPNVNTTTYLSRQVASLHLLDDCSKYDVTYQLCNKSSISYQLFSITFTFQIDHTNKIFSFSHVIFNFTFTVRVQMFRAVQFFNLPVLSGLTTTVDGFIGILFPIDVASFMALLK